MGNKSGIQKALKAHLNANQSYYDEGVRILELANKAYSLYLKQGHYERAKLLKIVLSACSLKDGTLCPTYKKPFDMLAKRLHVGNWRPGRYSQQNFLGHIFRFVMVPKQIGNPKTSYCLLREKSVIAAYYPFIFTRFSAPEFEYADTAQYSVRLTYLNYQRKR